MALADILGGLAGGLSQGLGQVQQNVEARRRSTEAEREMLLKQLMAARQQEELARQQALTPINSLEDGVEFDPMDPTYAPGVKIAGPGAFVKGASGKGLMKKPKAQNVMAEESLARFRAEAPLVNARNAQEMDELTAKKQLMDAMSAQYGQDWRRQMVGNEKIPMQARQAAAMILGKNPDWFLSPSEKLRYSESVGAAAVTASGMRDLRQANVANLENDNVAAMGNQFNQWLNTTAGKLASIEFKGNQQALIQKWMQERQAGGIAPQTMQVGKYQVSQ